MKRFALGFFYLVVFAVFSTYYQDSYFTTDEFGVRLCPQLILTSMTCSRLYNLSFQYFDLFFTGPALLVSLCLHSDLG